MTATPVYLDYSATTPLEGEVAAFMASVRDKADANPSSNHPLGREAASLVCTAESSLRQLLNVDAGQLIWTSGATEANNLALLGSAEQRAHRGRHIVTMRTEHKAVVDVCRALEKRGFEVTWLSGDAQGRLSAEELATALRDDTQLVSVMHVNNETGLIQDIAALGALCRERDVVFHVDGAQAAGRIAVDLAALPVDLYSLTAHKFYGPVGVGALYCRAGTVLRPQLYGGGQQGRLRPGTLPVALIAGFGRAAEISSQRLDADLAALRELRQRLLPGLLANEGVYLNGPDDDSGYPGIVNVGADGVDGESLLLALEPLCVATGSACNSLSQEPSYVLRALGRSDLQAQSAIRFSFGRQTTADEIDFAVSHYAAALQRLRGMAP